VDIVDSIISAAGAAAVGLALTAVGLSLMLNRRGAADGLAEWYRDYAEDLKRRHLGWLAVNRASGNPVFVRIWGAVAAAIGLFLLIALAIGVTLALARKLTH
jgi:hypothetical protein